MAVLKVYCLVPLYFITLVVYLFPVSYSHVWIQIYIYILISHGTKRTITAIDPYK